MTSPIGFLVDSLGQPTKNTVLTPQQVAAGATSVVAVTPGGMVDGAGNTPNGGLTVAQQAAVVAANPLGSTTPVALWTDATAVALRGPAGQTVAIGGGGSGTVTSVSVAAPAAGITASVATSTTTPAITLALADDLLAVEGLATTGIVRRTGTSAWSAGAAVNLAVEVTGVLAVANFATGAPTGLKFVRDDGVLAVPATGSGTVTSVNITAPAAGITASGGPVTASGAITLALANDLLAVEGIATTGIVRRTAADTWSAGAAVDLALEVAGTLPVANGGTGATTSTGTGAVVLATSPSVTSLTTNRLSLAGNISAPAWTTGGLRISGIPATLTDTTSVGTVAAAYTDSFGGNTIAAASATTFSQYFTAYFKDPIAGANVTFTAKFALGADSLSVGAAGISIAGATSGAIKFVAPAVAGNAVITPPGVTSTLATLGANTFTDSQTLTTGTKTTSSPIISGTQTWNAGAVPFDADLLNVTDTASASASYLIRRQLGGVDRFSVTKAGYMVSARAATDGVIQLGGDGSFYLYRIGSVFNIVGAGQIVSQAADLRIGQLSLGGAGASWDALITRAGAAQIQLGGADAAVTIGQTLRTQGSRVGIDNNVGAGKLTLGPGPGTGTGTLASLDLVSPIAVASGFGVQTQTRGLQVLNGIAVRTVYAALGLPTPSAAIEGGMAWCNDATMTHALGIGTIVVGGNSNRVPVSCDGTNWRIG